MRTSRSGMKNIGSYSTEITLCFLVLSLMVCVFRSRVEASTESSSSANPNAFVAPTPRSTPTPRPTHPAPLPQTQPTDKVWIVQGEIYRHHDSYSCRTRCKDSWDGRQFELLQSTRGSEDWMTHQNETVRCHSESRHPSNQFLVGGVWHTPASTPDEILCFLVIKEISDVQTNDAM